MGTKPRPFPVDNAPEALRNIDDVARLPGRDRLAAVQHHLVDLINYIEGKEGYTLFQGERLKITN